MFLTLFQLLTLDQWFAIRNETIKVTSAWPATIYILLWVWIGAFVFRNIFVGVLGQSAQRQRQLDFHQKCCVVAPLCGSACNRGVARCDVM